LVERPTTLSPTPNAATHKFTLSARELSDNDAFLRGSPLIVGDNARGIQTMYDRNNRDLESRLPAGASCWCALHRALHLQRARPSRNARTSIPPEYDCQCWRNPSPL